MTTHPYLKGIGTMSFIAVFFGAYFYVLKNPAYPVLVLPVTALDRWIPFLPPAFYVYATLWVYVSLPPALLASRRELHVYGAAMAVTCLAGLGIFHFWPTAVPVPDIDWAQHPGMEFLKNLDAAGNAFPSLHVATAVFSGIWLHHLLRRFGAPVSMLVINGVWCTGIIGSTLVIRQHVVVDVIAGLALGMPAGWLSLRWCLQAGVTGKIGASSA